MNSSTQNKLPFERTAFWIWSKSQITSTDSIGDVAFFRRSFNVLSKRVKLIVHVSADSRYVLYCNGKLVCRGPAKGDIQHHFYDTVDLTRYLLPGKNVISAVVIGFARHWPNYREGGSPVSVMSAANGFILDGILENSEGKVLEKLHTNASWNVSLNTGYKLIPQPGIIAFPGEEFNATLFPCGWTDPQYDDSSWKNAGEIALGVRPDNASDSWMPHRLMPRQIPFLPEKKERFQKAVDITGFAPLNFENLIEKEMPITLALNSQVEVLLDAGHLTTGYPCLEISGGQRATVRIIYAERLHRGSKIIRSPESSHDPIKGLTDICHLSSRNIIWQPLFWRTFRFIKLFIKTGSSPVRVHSLYYLYTAYPFPEKGEFLCSDPELNKIWQVGLRTFHLCAHETFEDCPYYEQCQYAGDTQVEALISYYATGDTALARQAIKHFNWSRNYEGITMSRYPSRVPQIIPLWSLHWLMMIYDYYWYTGDVKIVHELADGIRSVIEWFLRLRDEKSLVGRVPYWCVADWSPDWDGGIPPGMKEGPSALVNFLLVYCLRKSNILLKAIGKSYAAERYLTIADEISRVCEEAFWSEEKKLYLDRLKGKEVSQLTNAWAILSEVADQQKARIICRQMLSYPGICQAAFFGKFYIFRALAMVDDYKFSMFDPWRSLLKMGCTTWPEDPSFGRSECHAWSCAPNYEMMTSILGLSASSPGCKSLIIRPRCGNLRWAKGIIPIPHGEVKIWWRKENSHFSLKAEIPESTTALVILPDGSQHSIKSGRSELKC